MSNRLSLNKNSMKEIYWRKLDEHDCETVAAFVLEYFVKNEPVLLGIRFSDEEYSSMSEYAQQMVRNCHSLCAYDIQSKQILGIALIAGPGRACDIKPFYFGPNPTSQTRQVERANAQLARGLPVGIADDLSMRIEMLATEPKHTGLGIASALVERSLQLAKEEGCKHLLAECTSHFSARAFEKLGAVCLHQVRYAGYVDPPTGEHIFADVSPPHEAMKLMCCNI